MGTKPWLEGKRLATEQVTSRVPLVTRYIPSLPNKIPHNIIRSLTALLYIYIVCTWGNRNVFLQYLVHDTVDCYHILIKFSSYTISLWNNHHHLNSH